MGKSRANKINRSLVQLKPQKITSNLTTLQVMKPGACKANHDPIHSDSKSKDHFRVQKVILTS